MTNKRVYFNKSNQSCISGFQSLYGIGKLKATRLNSFLLNHPIQTKYSNNFKSLFNSVRGGDITNNLPLDKKVALHVETHLRKKISIFCYSAFRLFQNLPTRGQRTKANAKSISNHNPYKSLRINLSYYREMEVAYKKKELMNNERHDELNAYTEAQFNKEKMKNEDQKQKSRKTNQNLIQKYKNKK